MHPMRKVWQMRGDGLKRPAVRNVNSWVDVSKALQFSFHHMEKP